MSASTIAVPARKVIGAIRMVLAATVLVSLLLVAFVVGRVSVDDSKVKSPATPTHQPAPQNDDSLCRVQRPC